MQNTLIQTPTCLLPQITRELRHQLLITFRRCFSSGPFTRSSHAEFPPSSALYGSKASVTLPESIKFIGLIIKPIAVIVNRLSRIFSFSFRMNVTIYRYRAFNKCMQSAAISYYIMLSLYLDKSIRYRFYLICNCQKNCFTVHKTVFCVASYVLYVNRKLIFQFLQGITGK